MKIKQKTKQKMRITKPAKNINQTSNKNQQKRSKKNKKQYKNYGGNCFLQKMTQSPMPIS
ncbi:hypothetical protein CJU67_24740 [Escherichia coli]|jgi:hypothetical protein|nr:hypothetical protein CJU67_24740 [Escherichia coli]